MEINCFLKIYEESELSSLILHWIGRANSSSHTLTGVENSQTLSVHLWQRAANAASTLPSPPVSSSMLHLGFSHLCLPPHFLHAAPAPSSSSGASGHLIPNPNPSAAAAPVVLLPLCSSSSACPPSSAGGVTGCFVLDCWKIRIPHHPVNCTFI